MSGKQKTTVAILILSGWLLLSLSACRTTKQVNSERSTVHEQQEVTTKVDSEVAQQTQSQSRSWAETKITEFIDTIVKVFPVVDGKVSSEPVLVPVRQKRIIQKKEFSDQKVQQEQHVKVDSDKKEQQSKQTETRSTNKQVQRNFFPTWFLVAFIVALLIAGIWKIWKQYR